LNKTSLFRRWPTREAPRSRLGLSRARATSG